jgi:hypothetical protein
MDKNVEEMKRLIEEVKNLSVEDYNKFYNSVTKNNYIKIWNWEDAPDEYKSLSTHGGDETYVAFIPDGFTTMMDYEEDEYNTGKEKVEYPYVGFLDSGTMFGCCDVSHTKTKGGWVFIGAH